MLLPIMELAFKGSNEVKVRAFQAWQVLIDNFATNHGRKTFWCFTTYIGSVIFKFKLGYLNYTERKCVCKTSLLESEIRKKRNLIILYSK